MCLTDGSFSRRGHDATCLAYTSKLYETLPYASPFRPAGAVFGAGAAEFRAHEGHVRHFPDMMKRPALKGMRFRSWLLLGALAVGLVGMKEAQAAFGVGGATCSANSGSSGTTLQCTVATEAFDVNNVAVLWFAGDDAATADTVDHNNLLLTSVADSAGNVWTVQRCFTNVQATAAANGATTCVATARVTSAIPIGGTITATFGTTTAKAIVVREFTVAAGNALDVAGTPQDLANDGVDPGSMTISGLTSGEYLFVRSTASERDATAPGLLTTNYTTSNCDTTTGGGSAANMNICGEFRVLTGTGDTSDPTGTAVDNASIFIAFKEAANTTLGNGTDPSNASLAPGGAATMADAFTFQTSSGTDTITAVVVGLATGSSGGLSLVEITNDAGTTVYGSVADPASDTPSITLSTNTLTATTTSTQYKIRITPKSHAAMPVPPGSIYSVTAKINSWTGTNTAKDRHRHGGHHGHDRQPVSGECHRRLGDGGGCAGRAYLDQSRGRRFSQHRGVAEHGRGRGHARRRNDLRRRQHRRYEHGGVRRGLPDRELHRHWRHQRQQLLLPDFYPRQYRQLLGHRGGADGLAVHPQRPRLLFRGHRRLERHRDLGIRLRRHRRNLHRPGNLPSANEAVYVERAYTVTVPTGYSAAASSVTINIPTTNATTVLAVAGTGSLTVGGSITLGNPSGKRRPNSRSARERSPRAASMRPAAGR